MCSVYARQMLNMALAHNMCDACCNLLRLASRMCSMAEGSGQCMHCVALMMRM
jgi:hypothetical protein